MKRITSCAAFFLVSCSSAEPTQEEIKTVDWYKANRAALDAKVKECEANPGQPMYGADCINAGRAETQLTFEKRDSITFEPSSAPLPPSTAVAIEEKNTAPTKPTKKTKSETEKQQPAKEAPKEEEFELSQELIDFATQPIPIAKPRPIEIRNGTKNK
jgi:hypothetical protein